MIDLASIVTALNILNQKATWNTTLCVHHKELVVYEPPILDSRGAKDLEELGWKFNRQSGTWQLKL